MAQAGAWARGKGEVFVSTGLEFNESGDGFATLYAEWGALDRLTLGIDIFYDIEGTAGSDLAFARYTFLNQNRHVAAISLGYGLNSRLNSELFEYDPDKFVTLYTAETGEFTRLGLHYGYGFDWGWAALDATLDRGESIDENGVEGTFRYRKIDATLGYRVTERIAVMGQVFTFSDGSYSAATYGLGATYEFGKNTLEAALKQPDDGGEASLKLAFWRRF